MRRWFTYWIASVLLMAISQNANAIFESRFSMGSIGHLREACIVAVNLDDNEYKPGRESELKLTACYSIIKGAMSFPQMLCSLQGSEAILSNPNYPWLKALFTVDPTATPILVIREFIIEADKEPSKWESDFVPLLASVFQKFPCRKET